ncbi:nibrin isoform X2 [Periplaneta americana]
MVSRRDGDLILADDQSISRSHAVITVENDVKHLGNPSILPVVTLADLGSKYGTFINDGIEGSCRIAKDSKQILKPGDRIRFGLQWNEWRLEYIPLIVTASTLSSEEKKSLKQYVSTLGGHIVNNWQDTVTHVTMPSLTLTVKVVCALAHGKPIVTPQYWKSYVEAVSTKQAIPNYKDFIPPLAETTLNMHEVSFDVNEKRRTLFAGKQFVFSSPHQFNAYSCMVTAAGAKADVFEQSGMTYEDLIQPSVIVMQHSFNRTSQDSQVSGSFQEVAKYLKSKGKRVIPESEIGLAILYCSTDRHCNPDYHVTLILSGSNEVHSEPQLVLALDTQDSESNRAKPTGIDIIIPESGTVRKPPSTDTAAAPAAGEIVSKVKKERLSIMDEVDAAVMSPKRKRSSEDDGFLTASRCKMQPIIKEEVESNKIVVFSSPSNKKPRQVTRMSDDEEDDLFAFPSDNKPKRTSRMRDDDDEEEDLFAFPSEKKPKPTTSRINDDEEEEDLFSFVKEEKPIIVVNESSADFSKKRKSLKKEHDAEELSPLSKRPALEKDVFKQSKIEPQRNDVTLDGFLTVNQDKENAVMDESFLSLAENVKNVTIVEAKLLISPSVPASLSTNNSYPSGSNFKKFKKVRPGGCNSVIRANDMILYEVSNKGVSEWPDKVHDENVSDDEENDDDDWAFIKHSQSIKNKTRAMRR